MNIPGLIISCMIKQAIVVLFVGFLLLQMGCANRKVSGSSMGQADLLAYGPLWAAVYQQRAAEYKAMCFQAYNIARLRLDVLVQQPASMPMAVVTDIDETVLDNSPYTVHQALLGMTYNDSSWVAWTARVAADTVPGALSFFQYASRKGVTVFYVTNRLEKERDATIANLQKWGLPNADAAHLLLKGTTSSKDVRRAQVREQYEVLLLLGDNLGDFTGIYDHQLPAVRDSLVRAQAPVFGDRFIVLPNPMYGEWQGALIRYNYKLTHAQQYELFLQQLIHY